VATEGAVGLAGSGLLRAPTSCAHDVVLVVRSIRERERTRLARFLHDDIGQDLALVRGNVVDLIGESGADGGLLCNSLVDLDRVMGRLRTQVGDLLSAGCDVWDFLAATLELTERMTARGRIVAHTSIDAPTALLQSLDDQCADAGWTAVRGALNNAERHSQGTEVKVTFEVGDDRLLVTVEDDGRGLDNHAVGHGTRLMTECVRRVGGLIRFSSPANGRDRGTSVHIGLPLGGT
jgi:signal transduction histidine kinase